MAQGRDQHKQFQERVVHIARVAKVVKGGRRFSFSALVCVGDNTSRVGFGVGKANEVPDAIRKAADVSSKNMLSVPVADSSTIPFQVIGKSGSTRVLMYPAPHGKGIIAGSAARMIFDLCGIKDIVCKIHGSRNHHNVVRATFNGLSQLQSIEDYAALRGLAPEDVLQKRQTKSGSFNASKSAKSSTETASEPSAGKELSAGKEPSADKEPSNSEASSKHEHTQQQEVKPSILGEEVSQSSNESGETKSDETTDVQQADQENQQESAHQATEDTGATEAGTVDKADSAESADDKSESEEQSEKEGNHNS